ADAPCIMFASSARVVPANATAFWSFMSAETRSALSSCTTSTLSCSVQLSSPFGPFMRISRPEIVTWAPLAISIGRFATRDMSLSSSGHDAEHLAALPAGTRGATAHHALRGGDNGDTEAAQHRRQFVLALVHAQ